MFVSWMELKQQQQQQTIHYCISNFFITHKVVCFAQIKITKALGEEVPLPI